MMLIEQQHGLLVMIVTGVSRRDGKKWGMGRNGGMGAEWISGRRPPNPKMPALATKSTLKLHSDPNSRDKLERFYCGSLLRGQIVRMG
jgi:hypothetical protein